MSTEPTGLRPGRRLSYDSRIFLLALTVGLPGLLLALGLLWGGPHSARLRWTATLFLVPSWLLLAIVVREQVVRPLGTLANVLASFREGDFSIRARSAGVRGALALAYEELNQLESVLRVQRIGAVEASALLQKVLSEIDVAVFAFDDTERLRLLNRSAERLLDSDEARVLGSTADELRLGSVLRGPAPRTVELSHAGARAGRWEVRRSVARQEGERLDLIVLTDLSRALREEEREAWKRLVRVLGHEINNSLTPIRSISTSLHEMLESAAPPEDVGQDVLRGLDVIRGRAESLSRFMSSYARLARLPPPDLAPVTVSDWVRHVVGLETRCDVAVVPGPEVIIRADRDQLEQALINLVGNAAEAIEPTDGEVEVTWAVGKDSLEVFVEDDGPGLSDTSNLFVPFYTTKPSGSGIGLVLSRQIVEGHGGSLILEARDGNAGVRARMTLPIDTPEE